jgi:hypothetical protein
MKEPFVNIIFKQSMKFILLSFLALTINGCSSSSKKEIKDVDNSDSIKRDYEIRDASSNTRPGWISDPHEWAKENSMDIEKFRFFSFETTPKVDREVACSLAKSNVRADIASEISTYIEKNLGSSKEGAASIDENNPQGQALREFIEVTLAEKTQAMLNGASIVKTYWEKRQYLQNKGAKRDFIGMTCAVLIRIEESTLKNAIEKASNALVDKVDDPSTKANVKEALKNVAENFVKSRKGEI